MQMATCLTYLRYEAELKLNILIQHSLHRPDFGIMNAIFDLECYFPHSSPRC